MRYADVIIDISHEKVDRSFEYGIPEELSVKLKEGMSVEVLRTDAVWFGVTYREDKDYVSAELQKLHDAGIYPAAL